MDLLKNITGKVVGGLVALGVIAAAISWFEMDPASRRQIVSGALRIGAWVGIVAVLPWATFFLIGSVARLESNLAGGMLVAGYTALEAVGLAWLFAWSVKSPTAIGFFGAAVLLAAAYNLLICDWIAEKVE